MKEVTGNIWDYHEQGCWVVITTNGTVKENGDCVMGRGVALEAKKRFWNIAGWLGFRLRSSGNHCYVYTGQQSRGGRFEVFGVITFPVKHNWWEKADSDLIERSCRELVGVVDSEGLDEVYMVRPGCGNGQLDWKDVRPILEKYLDDRFVIVQV